MRKTRWVLSSVEEHEAARCVQLEIDQHDSHKRKARREREKLEKTMLAVVDRVMKAQESSDAKFTALEEKRMKFEERLVEIEERQRREDREFQMRMWMIMQGMHPPPPGISLGAAGPPAPSASQSGSHLYSTPPPTIYGYPPSYVYDHTDDEHQDI